jgi:hypothetical protein
VLWGIFDTAFTDLLTAWRRHDELRRSQASLAERVASRDALEAARHRADRVRRAFAPEPGELHEVAVASFCEVLGATVLLYHRDAIRRGAAPSWVCLCGAMVGSDAAVVGDQ